MCLQGDETIDHLLVQCVYSREVWFKIFRWLGWARFCPTADEVFCSSRLRSRKMVPKSHRKAFDSAVVLAAWCLWLQHNDRVFRNGSVCASAVCRSSICRLQWSNGVGPSWWCGRHCLESSFTINLGRMVLWRRVKNFFSLNITRAMHGL
jgi:hypothetical protein